MVGRIDPVGTDEARAGRGAAPGSGCFSHPVHGYSHSRRPILGIRNAQTPGAQWSVVGRRSNHERHTGRAPRRPHPRGPGSAHRRPPPTAAAPSRPRCRPRSRTRRAAGRAPPAAPPQPRRSAWQAPQAQPPRRLPAVPASRLRPTGRRPQAYAGQPAPTGSRTPSAVRSGSARRRQTQPTVPLGRAATGAPRPPTPRRRRSPGAGKVVGLIVAAAIVGGAAGLGGAYAGVNLFAPAGHEPRSRSRRPSP